MNQSPLPATSGDMKLQPSGPHVRRGSHGSCHQGQTQSLRWHAQPISPVWPSSFQEARKDRHRACCTVDRPANGLSGHSPNMDDWHLAYMLQLCCQLLSPCTYVATIFADIVQLLPCFSHRQKALGSTLKAPSQHGLPETPSSSAS